VRPVRTGAVLASALATVTVLTACTGGAQSGAPNPSTQSSAPATSARTPSAGIPSAGTPSGGTPSSAPSSTGPANSGPTPVAVPAALARFYAQQPTWTQCTDAQQSLVADTAQCATIEVPLDYAVPAAGTIRLALDRIPATDRAGRIGSLLVNPGGPGGSGLDYAKAADRILGEKLRARYDVVGFDPRGVGQSTPVKCLTDSQLDTFIATDPDPETPAEIAQSQQQAELLANGCQAESARLLPHVGTPDAARDMDVIRAVVGDQKLTYLGKSYGTYLGAVYAGLFPSRVGRLVLDGAIDPSLSSDELDLGQAAGFQTALDAFLTDWVRQGDCPLGDTTVAAERRLTGLLAGVQARPLPTGTDRELTGGQAFLGVVGPLYDRQAWPTLRTALTELVGGRGDTLLRIADLYSDRGPDGYTSNANEAIYAVNCLDRPDTDTVAQVRAQLPVFERASPVFGASLAWSSLPCTDWPVKSRTRPARITAAGAPPILVVGTTRDPATPYAWAQSLARQLSSGVLLSRDGDGHTAYFMGNACIDSAVETYLLNGTPPADGTRCRA